MRKGSPADRRQITILFCDVVDSSRLAADPEKHQDVIQPYHAACNAIIERFGGRVSQFLGDGVLCVFGHPHAHEDDALHATQAGIALAQRIPRLPLPPGLGNERLAVRVGIATGLVATGDGAGAGPDGHAPYGGQAPILAQRLQDLAPENGVLIARNTYSIVGERFDCVHLGTRTLKGLAEPEEVWRVLSEQHSDTRYFSRPGTGPLVGRQVELSRLMQLWGEVRHGSGRAILISGEAGIGKSRLLQTLLEQIDPGHVDVRQFQCDPLYVNTALYPMIERIRRSAGISGDDPESVKFDKLKTWHGDRRDDAVAMLGALLSLSPDERHPLPVLSPQRYKEKLFELLVEHLFEVVGHRPLIAVFEDIHWIDPTTEEFITLLISRMPALPVLLLFTSRPDYEPKWSVERCELQPMKRQDAIELVKSVAGAELDSHAIEQVVDMADGVPLFIEELTKFVSETSRSRGVADIPARLRDPLTARLDQVGEARLIAQVASVIGRQFSYVLLTSVVQGAEKSVDEGLRRLEQAELIHAAEPSSYGWSEAPTGTLTENDGGIAATTFVFKHALLQKAAYDSLLHRVRPELHRRTAEALEALFPQTVRDEPELLAHHWTEAGNPEKGAAAWLLAGQLASERCEYREAIARLRRGLALVPSISNEHVRRSQELALILALGPALIMTEGAGTEEVGRLYARAMELCNHTPLSPMHFVAHWGWWRTTMDHRTGRARADKLLALAERLNKPELSLQAHHCQWATLYMVGQYRECCEHVEAGLRLYDGTRDRVHSALYGGHDARVCGLGESALANWMFGHYDLARKRAEAALEWSSAISHVGSRVHAMDYALVLHKFGRDFAAVQSQAQTLLEFATEQRLRVPCGKAQFFRGWARAMQGAVAEGLEEMLDGIASERAADTPHDFTLYFEMLAEVHALAGRLDESLDAVRDAFAIAERHGIVYWNAELHRRLGEVMSLRGDRDDAEAELHRALECARSQEARSLELRAAIALARLQKEPSDSIRALLQSACAWFPQATRTPDLENAHALLRSMT